MSIEVTHEPAAQRFVATLKGQESVLDYELANNTMTILRTAVPPSLRGRGVAADLTRFALDTARRHDWNVVPVCSYAQHFLSLHPDYTDLEA